MARDDGCAQDAIRSLPAMDLDESFTLAFENRAVNRGHVDPERIDRDSLLCGIVFVEADVGNFRIDVGTPRNRQGACPAAPEKERVADHDARHRVGGMGELVREADIAAAWILRFDVRRKSSTATPPRLS